MEILGFQKAMDFLEENKLLSKLKIIIADKDGKVLRFIRENPERFSHIEVIHDPGSNFFFLTLRSLDERNRQFF